MYIYKLQKIQLAALSKTEAPVEPIVVVVFLFLPFHINKINFSQLPIRQRTVAKKGWRGTTVVVLLQSAGRLAG